MFTQEDNISGLIKGERVLLVLIPTFNIPLLLVSRYIRLESEESLDTVFREYRLALDVMLVKISQEK